MVSCACPEQGIGAEQSTVGQYKAYLVLTLFFVQRWKQVILIKTLTEKIFPVSQTILKLWYILTWMSLPHIYHTDTGSPLCLPTFYPLFPSVRTV